MERLYVGAKQRGECDSPVEFVVIDEADCFTTDDPEHIINRMVKELRKFGVGMVLAGQSFEHFSDDLLMSASVKLVLGCPEMFMNQTRRRRLKEVAAHIGRSACSVYSHLDELRRRGLVARTGRGRYQRAAATPGQAPAAAVAAG